MASSQQRQARHWNLASWDKEDGWDEWYEKAENTMRVQHVEIIGLQEDLRDVNNDLHVLTATMHVIANAWPNSASVFPGQAAVASSASGLPSTAVAHWSLPNPSTAVAHWPSPNPADHQPQRPCDHGMKDQFYLPFTVADHSEFSRFS